MKARLIAAIMMIIAASLAQAQTLSHPPLKVGDKAPSFALINADGKIVTLDDYLRRGAVVLVFYRGYW